MVLLSLDTLRADHVSSYGYPRPTAPVLDAFAAEAVRFEEAYAQSTGTLTSHLSLLTSLYPPQLRITRDDGRNDDQSRTTLRLSREVDTLAEVLRAEGYRTAAFTDGGPVTDYYGFDDGFQVFHERPLRGARGLAAILPRLRRFLEGRASAGERADPLFLFLHSFDVHEPYIARRPFTRAFSDRSFAELHRDLGYLPIPAELNRRLDALDPADAETVRDLYDNGIRSMDARLQELFALLRAHGLYDESVVVVLSDHGEEFLEHGAFNHGRTVYEEVVRVPLLVRAPGMARPGAVVRRPVELVDVAPTVLELVGLPVPEQFQGRSLAGLVEGREAGDAPSERPVYFDTPNVATGVQGIRRGPWKLVRSHRGELELFHLGDDPGERDDRSGRDAEVRDRLASELETWVTRMEETGRRRGWHAFLPPGRSEGEVSGEAREQLRELGYLE